MPELPHWLVDTFVGLIVSFIGMMINNKVGEVKILIERLVGKVNTEETRLTNHIRFFNERHVDVKKRLDRLEIRENRGRD